ncbi:MAG: tetratricopeptide repeat protein [Acidobacteriaceae bacterium]
MGEPSFEIESASPPSDKRLDSWKEIAAYLNRDVTTVQRWEKREGMPVHRHQHDKRGSVYALAGELNAWAKNRSLQAGETDPVPGSAPPAAAGAPSLGATPWMRLAFALAVIVILGLAIASWLVRRPRPTASQPPTIHSVAVLPLRNLSGDPSQDYLAEGFTEALIGSLSEIHDLRVVSHTSVQRFSNTQLSTPQIARMLSVDALVEGSVIRDGDRIRVTAQLIRGASDEHFWSETYDRGMGDALTLESELAQAIADKVEVTVSGDERHRLASVRPVAPEVYESYLQGNFLLNQGNTRATLEQSESDFEAAVRRDPDFAPAYVGLARVYANLGTIYAGVSPAETRPKVVQYAQHALALDPNLVLAHVLLASSLQREWHWTEAETEYRRALGLNANNAAAHAAFASWLSCEGRADEAISEIRFARQLDPATVSGSDVASILFHSHRFDDAVREARSAAAVDPDDASVLMTLGFALIADNQAADAVPVLEKAVALSQGSPAVTGVLIRAYAHAGRRADALRLLASLKRRKAAGYIPAGAFVNAYLGLDDREQAFYWLEQAFREKSTILQFVKTHPYFDPIRSDPRFVDLVHRVGLS